MSNNTQWHWINPTSVAKTVGTFLFCATIAAVFTWIIGELSVLLADPVLQTQVIIPIQEVLPVGPWPGIESPSTRSIADAKISDDEEVIGVCVGEKSRAYLLSAMDGPTRHVINDLIGGRAITATYCDIRGTSRVLTDERAKIPLNIGVGGLDPEGMFLHIAGKSYLQMTGRCLTSEGESNPYESWPHTVTTWKKWRDEHANTDLYAGDQRATN